MKESASIREVTNVSYLPIVSFERLLTQIEYTSVYYKYIEKTQAINRIA